MKYKLAIFIDTAKLSLGSVNWEELEYGNPGIGGTEYMYLLLGLNLMKRGVDVTYLTTDTTQIILNEKAVTKNIYSFDHCMEMAEEEKCDFLIIRQNDAYNVPKTKKSGNTKIICWIHNYISYAQQRTIAENENIWCCVFVGKQHYDKYLDCDIINKSTFIYNFFDISKVKTNAIPRESKKVVYIGSLTYPKGFHMLAAAWPGVLKCVPDARLYVIGSGNLYNKNHTLGIHGVAEEKYENLLFNLLGNTSDTVQFLGNLGAEKNKVMADCKVGIANPTGRGETFCISAVEMQACGLPVITRGANGLLDTVSSQSGIYVSNERQLTKAIVKVLQDPDAAASMGKNGRIYVERRFSTEQNIDKWMNLFDTIKNNREIQYIAPDNYFFHGLKFLRMMNRRLRRVFKISDRFSILHMQEYLRDHLLGHTF